MDEVTENKKNVSQNQTFKLHALDLAPIQLLSLVMVQSGPRPGLYSPMAKVQLLTDMWQCTTHGKHMGLILF